MEKLLTKFPTLNVDILKKRINGEKTKIYIYKQEMHRGIEVTGLASILCLKFDGSQTLKDTLDDFYFEMNLEPELYEEDAKSLINHLIENNLIEFSDTVNKDS